MLNENETATIIGALRILHSMRMRGTRIHKRYFRNSGLVPSAEELYNIIQLLLSADDMVDVLRDERINAIVRDALRHYSSLSYRGAKINGSVWNGETPIKGKEIKELDSLLSHVVISDAAA